MPKPILYLMFGYPGAGKTTTAHIIAELTGAVLLSSDKMRLSLFPSPKFTEEEHQILYKTLDDKTRVLLKEGKSVVYDANLNRLAHRREKYEICQSTGAESVLIWVKTPKRISKARALNRSRSLLVPKNETLGEMFERISGVIEEPLDTELFFEIDGTNVSRPSIWQLLNRLKLI